MSRLIDADALSIAVMDAFSIGDVDEDVIWGLVQDAPTIQQPEWISCAVRLPEQRDDVLVCTNDCDIYIADYVPGLNQWFVGDWLRSDIIAWIPLPQPPKEGE